MENTYRLSNYGENALEALVSPETFRKELISKYYTQEQVRAIEQFDKQDTYSESQIAENIDKQVVNELMRQGVIESADSPKIRKTNPLRDVNTAVIDLTYACNLTCPNKCYHQKGKGQLNTSELKQVIDTFKKMGVGTYYFHGGEPTLRKDLKEIISHASEEGKYHVSMVTNGLIPNPEKYLSELVDAGLNQIYFSVDGIKEDHDIARGKKGAFDYVINTIASAQAINKRLAKEGRRLIGIAVSSTPENPKSRDRFISEIKNYIPNAKLYGREDVEDCDIPFTVNDRIWQIANAADFETREGTSQKSFDDLRTPTCSLQPDRILVRPDGVIGHCWIGYAGGEFGKLDRTSLETIQESLIKNLNSIQQTEEYKVAAEGRIKETVKYVNRSMFPEKYEMFCTPMVITLGVWYHMNKLAAEQDKQIDDPEIIKQANQIVAEEYGFKTKEDEY